MGILAKAFVSKVKFRKHELMARSVKGNDFVAHKYTVSTTRNGTLGALGLPYRSGRAVADSAAHMITGQRGAERATALPEQSGRLGPPSVPLHVMATVLSRVSLVRKCPTKLSDSKIYSRVFI